MALATILVVAVFTEGLTEWIKNGFPKLAENTPLIYAVTAVIGIGICIGANVGILNTLGINCNIWLDHICSGIIISRGSNYVYDLTQKLTTAKEEPTEQIQAYGTEEGGLG